MIRMAGFPIRKDYCFRPSIPDLFSKGEAVFHRCRQTRIAEIQSFSELRTYHQSSGFRFFGTDFRGAASSQLPLCEVKNAYRVSLIDHFEERAGARQLNVVGVR